MKYVGVVTDRSLGYMPLDAWMHSDTKTRKDFIDNYYFENNFEKDIPRSNKRIYSDEVPMADEVLLFEIKNPSINQWCIDNGFKKPIYSEIHGVTPNKGRI